MTHVAAAEAGERGTMGQEEGRQDESSTWSFPRKLASIWGMMLSPCQQETGLEPHLKDSESSVKVRKQPLSQGVS